MVSYFTQNRHIIDDLEKLTGLKTLLTSKRRELKKLQLFVNELAERIQAAESTDFVFANVAMTEIFNEIHAVSSEISRYARVYKNVDNNKTWGLLLRFYGPLDDSGGEFMGSYWKRKKDVVYAAKRWVAFGEKPEYDGGIK